MAEKDLTTGSVAGLILRLALPVLGSFLLESTYALVDLYFVGRLGGPALAGLGISLNTFFVMLSLAMVLGVGAMAVISQTYGRGERSAVRDLYQQIFWATLVVGALAWLAGWLLTPIYFDLFTPDPAVHAQGSLYFRIYAATFLTQVFLIVNSFCFRAVGDFITPTLLMVLGFVLNLILDPLLIFGLGPFPRLEMQGAALATVISQLVVALVYLWLVTGSRRNTLLRVRLPFSLDPGLLWKMVRIGIPSGTQVLLFSLMMMVIYRVVGQFGGDASAGVGVGFRIIHAAFLPVLAVGSAVASLTGQNYGARKLQRVKSAVVWGGLYAAVLMISIYGLILLDPAFWAGLFSRDAGVIALAALYLKLTGIALPMHGTGYVVTSLAQGLGRTLYPLMGQAMRVAGFLLALSLLHGVYSLGLRGVFWSYAIAFLGEFVVMAGVVVYLWRTVLSRPETTETTESPSGSGPSSTTPTTAKEIA